MSSEQQRLHRLDCADAKDDLGNRCVQNCLLCVFLQCGSNQIGRSHFLNNIIKKRESYGHLSALLKHQSVKLLIVYYSSCKGEDYCQSTDASLESIA